MVKELKFCPLFRGMSDEEIEICLKESKARVKEYKRDEIIFSQGEKPKYITILVEGTVAVCNDSNLGRRTIMAIFRNIGEIFGEVFLFLGKEEYDHYALSTTNSKILTIPKDFIFDESSTFHGKILANMLNIFASKSYYLNKRIQILSSSNLRQKIARLILQESKDGKVAFINMNREEMADFISVARPSLSRELMKMQDEGLIEVEKDKIHILDIEELMDL